MVKKTVEKMLHQNGEKLRNGGRGCVLETTFGRIGLTNAQASWLAQVGRGVLIGQEHVSLRELTCKTPEL